MARAPIISTKEVQLPVGERVYVDVTTADVIHSFWIPRIGGKIDMIQGQINRILLKAGEAGEFRGPCYEFCGAQHENMAFSVVADAARRIRRVARERGGNRGDS